MKVIRCDKCGDNIREANARETSLFFPVMERVMGITTVKNKKNKFHLCAVCTNKLYEFLEYRKKKRDEK